MRTLTLLVLVLAGALAAFAGDHEIGPIQAGNNVYALVAATATGPGDAIALARGAKIDVLTTAVYAAGSPSALAANLEGAIERRVVTDAAITSGTAALASAAAGFSAVDLGKEVRLAGAGAGGGYLVATISAVTDATHVTLSASATTTVTGATAEIARWFLLDATTTVPAEMRHVLNKRVTWVRVNLATLTGGSSPAVTAVIGAF